MEDNFMLHADYIAAFMIGASTVMILETILTVIYLILQLT